MRESGILMHITSLPNNYGIGTMGKCAYDFIDFLDAAGQSYWQILPLNPTGFGDSPYQAFSSCAGNPYLIDLDILVEEGLLLQEEITSVQWERDTERVDFGIMYECRLRILEKAFERFTPTPAYEAFVSSNSHWLKDYGLFMALKAHFGGEPWLNWPEEIKLRVPESLNEMETQLQDKVAFFQFLQYQFRIQWDKLRRYAAQKNIRVVGDVPIYVPLDSADVWANPASFQLDENRYPTRVAGCPPDAFTEDGQLWGNPLYNWDLMKETGYQWWIRRLKAAKSLYDVIRLDHFRGFESYWSIPYGDATAKNGCWVKGPGMEFLGVVKQELPELEFIAEDLGYLTEEVHQMQKEFGFPGMKVLQFAFDSREESDYIPHLYPVDSVCYTGTHDNATMQQWFDEAGSADLTLAKTYLGLNTEEGYVWGVIRGAMGSVSRLCIVPMQDYLSLGKHTRMNQPGLLSSANWTWRATPEALSNALAAKIRQITCLYGRLK